MSAGWISTAAGAVRCNCHALAQAPVADSPVSACPQLATPPAFERFAAGPRGANPQRYNDRIAALRRAQRFATEFPAAGHRGLLLHGPDTAGLTHLAAATIAALAARGAACLWCECSALCRASLDRWDWDATARRQGSEFHARVSASDVVVVASLGTAPRTEPRVDAIEEILRARWLSMRGLVVTTPLPLQPPPPTSGWPRGVRRDTLRDRIGPHAMGWLLEHCAPVELPRAAGIPRHRQ